MRIALYANIAHSVPPEPGQILAPWMLSAELVNRLVDHGHHVTLYAAKESHTKAQQHIHSDISLANLNTNGKVDHDKVAFLDNALLSLMYQQAIKGDYDIIHIHHPASRAMYFAPFSTIPTLVTLHDPINKTPYVFDYCQRVPQLHIAPISHQQTTARPELPYTQVVYNGIDINQFSFNPNPGSYLMIASRIVPEKGFHTAIAVAKEMQLPLYIAGTVNQESARSVQYWNEQIVPHIDQQQILYVGALNPDKLATLYQGAKAFLFPIEWDEPFGLVMAEAMACGTPVVAFNRGAAPEVINHGQTGYIVETKDQMLQAVATIDRINRLDCRHWVEAKFSLDTMVEGYEQIYRQLAGSI